MYAKEASNIRSAISRRASVLTEEDKDAEANQVEESKHHLSRTCRQSGAMEDLSFGIEANPAHPCRRRRPLRQLSVETRL